MRNVNVISVCVSACMHACMCIRVCLSPSSEAGYTGRWAEIYISGSVGNLSDLSTYNASGGLPAKNLGSSLSSQEERHAETGAENESREIKTKGSKPTEKKGVWI